jgi:lysophospholipase L1-like esterase
MQLLFINKNKMKQYRWIVLLPILCLSSFVSGQIKYYDAAPFPLIGKITDQTETRYERLPAYLKDKTRPRVWQLGKNTSGLAIRFRSNSTSISAKWDLYEDVSMNHMTATGIKGLDLYAWTKDHWQFVNTGRPTSKTNEQTIIANMSAEEREYLLFLPLYDGVSSLSIGIDSTATILQPVLNYPDTKHPVVCYGTSITQGGCASRPGMSYSNILMRRFNREFINLGFSGNGQLDYEIAGMMAKRHDVSLFVLDFIPNVSTQQIKEKTEKFVRILREENPKTPILLVESVIFPHSYFDQSMHQLLIEKNNALREEYKKIKQHGCKNIYYLSSDHFLGKDGDATVDGIHLTDLGFERFSEKLYKGIKKIL